MHTAVRVGTHTGGTRHSHTLTHTGHKRQMFTPLHSQAVSRQTHTCICTGTSVGTRVHTLIQECEQTYITHLYAHSAHTRTHRLNRHFPERPTGSDTTHTHTPGHQTRRYLPHPERDRHTDHQGPQSREALRHARPFHPLPASEDQHPGRRHLQSAEAGRLRVP